MAMEGTSRVARIDSSKNSTSSAHILGEAEAIVRSLNGFYDMVGHKPEESGTLGKMAAYFLTKGITPAQVTVALDLCIEQCRYPVRLPDIMQRIPGYEVPVIEAEARAAWDTVIKFVDKYVASDAEGRYGPEHGMYAAWGPVDPETRQRKFPARYPQIPQRILDVVRRTGGWIQYRRMSDEDMPFQQKRFFEEYIAWSAVEQVTDFRHILAMAEDKALSLTGSTDQKGETQSPRALDVLAAAKDMDGQRSVRPAANLPDVSPERKAELRKKLEEELAKRNL